MARILSLQPDRAAGESGRRSLADILDLAESVEIVDCVEYPWLHVQR